MASPIGLQTVAIKPSTENLRNQSNSSSFPRHSLKKGDSSLTMFPMTFPSLYSPLQVGAIQVPNRIFMAPMTRLRSVEPGDVPTALMGEYYSQRASAGLIISEATQVSFQAKGYSGAPGLHTDEQVAAWARITAQVHDAGGHMAVQLWHTGRISHASLQPDGLPPVAPSAISANSRTTLRDAHGRAQRVETSTPRALEASELPGIVADFKQAVVNAKTAGFDLVELHGAHGYLLHQFLSPTANLRTDAYGGSIEKRARLALEVIDAAIDGWSADRIGFRIYPLGPFNGIDSGEDQEDAALYLIEQLAARKLAYLHISEPDWAGGTPLRASFRKAIRQAYPGVIIGAGGYTPEKAEELISAGLIDAAAFGRSFIPNPDLVERIRRKAPMNEIRSEEIYVDGAQGYTDYPSLQSA